MSVIQIKRSTTSTVPTSNSGGASSTIDAGELTYSYAAGDGSGDESGVGKLFIGHPDGKSGSNAAVIIGGSVYTNMLDHTAGTATASSAVILNSASHIDAVKTAALSIGASGSETLVTSTAAELNTVDVTAGTATASKAVVLDSNAATSAVKTAALHLGASGSETLVSATGAEINKLDGVTATTAQLNFTAVTAGTATASKAVVLNAASHIDTVKTTALHIGASGSATQVTATAAELNILDDATLDTAELNKLDGCTATTAELNYVDVTTAGAAQASKAVILDSNSHINAVKTAALSIGSSGSETLVTSTAAELNLLDGITAIDTDLSSVAGGHTTLASALATKTYVDNTRSGLEVKDSVVVATTADVSTWTYANGTAGVGATLTASGNGVVAIDGVNLALNNRVLVKDQNPATENGIYYVSTAGAVGATLVLTRTTDADTAAELSSGVFFFVEKGSANADSGYVMTQDTAITFGSTTVDFAQFSGAGQITAGNGLAKSSNTLSVNTGTGITITSDNVVIDTSWAGQTAITTLGTVATGTWNATAISAAKGGTAIDTSSSTGVAIVTSGTWTTPTSLTVPFGGTGAASFTSNGILYGNAGGAIAVTAAGTDKYFLYSNSGTPAWTNTIDGGTF
jgi:hypothetical protein